MARPAEALAPAPAEAQLAPTPAEQADALLELYDLTPGRDWLDRVMAVEERLGADVVAWLRGTGAWEIFCEQVSPEKVTPADVTQMQQSGTWALAERRYRETRERHRQDAAAASKVELAALECRSRRRVAARPRGAGRPRAVVRSSSRGGDSGDSSHSDEPGPGAGRLEGREAVELREAA